MNEMKKHRLWYNRKFNVNSHVMTIDLFSQCVTSNPQQRSYRKKLCKVTFSNTIEENDREYVQICFTDMRAAVVFITNHIDTNSMKLNIFGKQYLVHLTVLSCNYKLYIINSVDNKDVWETFIESNA